MRNDPALIQQARAADTVEWRFVVQIVFPTSSPSFTSRAGIADVPGDNIDGTIVSISSRSQQVYPEEGRTTIGTLTIDLLDAGSPQAITAELRSQLLDGAGVRDRELRLYVGATDDFDDFTRIATAFVDDVSYEAGVYRIRARDRTKQLRDQILRPKETRLAENLAATDTTVSVTSTAGFQRVYHQASYADAPGQTVGYFRIRESGEIIRYTGTTSTTFTGCTRGVLRTKAEAVEWDAADPQDQWPLIEEVIYLELPGPAAAIALATGITDVNASPRPTLPDHWHLGLPWPDAFVTTEWLNIGADLWDPADYAAGFPVRFVGLTEADGKAFIEKEIFRLLGLFSPTSAFGKLGLRRINRVIASNGYVARLTADNIVRHGPLRYDLEAVQNQFTVDYNYEGREPTRTFSLIDVESVSRNGLGKATNLAFRGLHTERHTQRAITERLATLIDRYSEPPLRLQVEVLGELNWLEIGDTVLVDLPTLQCYVDGTDYLRRCFEVQSTDVNWTTGQVTLQLFASGRTEASRAYNPNTTAPLATSWYTSSGTNIASLTGYVAASGGTPARLTANVTLNGTSDINEAGSIWYHNGDLRIDSGVTVTVVDQAQLRVAGFVTVNGAIDGAGNGPAGVSDGGTVGAASDAWSAAGTSGYIGPTRPGDGVVRIVDLGEVDIVQNAEGAVAPAVNGNTAIPPVTVTVDSDGAVTSKLPKVFWGSSGGRGGRAIDIEDDDDPPGNGTGGIIRAKGGNGGAGGAGLVIWCRGLGFGPSGYIDLSGEDGTAGGKTSGWYLDVRDTRNRQLIDYSFQAGAGAGGMPGALHVLLDGDGVPYPSFDSATLRQYVGETPTAGFSAARVGTIVRTLLGAQRRYGTLVWPEGAYSGSRGVDQSPEPRLTGRNEHLIAAGNIWPAASYVQFVPATGDPAPEVLPLPRTLVGAPLIEAAALTWTPEPAFDAVEVYVATTNDRAFAGRAATVAGAGGEYTHPVPGGGVRYFWIRGIKQDGLARRVSDWHPSSATAGVAVTVTEIGRPTIGSALNSDPNFATTQLTATNPWQQVAGSGAQIQGVSDGQSGGRALYGLTASATVLSTTDIAIDPTKTYRARVKFRALAVTTRKLRAFVAFYDAFGGLILGSTSPTSGGWLAYDTYRYFVDEAPTTAWQTKELTFGAKGAAKIPAQARLMRIGVTLHDTTSGSGATVHQVQDLRIDEVVPSVLIEDGAITAVKLVADLVLASLVRSAGSGFRVELEGGARHPIWAGTGTKGTTSDPGSGAVLWLDATLGKLGIRGTLEASRIAPDGSNVMPIETDTDTFAPIASRVVEGTYTDSAIGTTFVALQPGVQVYHPTYSTGLEGKRLQDAQQPVLVAWRLAAWNGTGATRTMSVALQYRYDSGTWTDVDGYTDGILSTRDVPNGRPAYLEDSLWCKPKASGWSTDLQFRLRVKVDSSAAGFTTCGMGMELSIFNLGAVDDAGTTLDDG